MTTPALRPFTSRTRVALAIARAVAAARGDADLTTTHVALGFLREGRNPALAMLAQAGLALPVMQYGLQPELEQALGEPGRPQPRQVVLELTAGEEAIVALAEKQAEALSAPYVGTEHLLLAIVAQPEDPVAQVLGRHGVTMASALDALQKIFSGAPLPTS